MNLTYWCVHTHTHTHTTHTPHRPGSLPSVSASLHPLPHSSRLQWHSPNGPVSQLHMINDLSYESRSVRYTLPCSTNMTSLHGCAYCVAKQLGEAHAIRCQLALCAVLFCVGGALIHGGHHLEMNMYMFAFHLGTP